MPLLSISIDLSRSTETKSVISDIITTDNKHYLDTIKSYFYLFMNIESQFYFHAFHKNIDLMKLFLVKSIGDELWFVYDINEGDDKKAIPLILGVLLEITYHVNQFPISERNVEWEEEEGNINIWNNVKHIDMYLPVKCYVDYLNNYEDFTLERNKYIIDNITSLYKERNNKYTSDELSDFIKRITETLNLGKYLINDEGKKCFTDIRFDPIGIDVDLFFRCTKFSLPCVVTIGEKLYNYIKPEKYSSSLKFEIKESINHSTYDYVPYIHKKISQSEIKGITHDYNIYYLLNKHCSNYFTKNNEIDDGCDLTRQMLLDNGFIKPHDSYSHFSKVPEKWKK